MKQLANQVVVITGTSTGIGRATAIEFARRKATVVLAARREEVLRDLAGQCETLGGRALIFALDVSDPGAVAALARKANETFGRIDVWVNNAAVTAFGRLEETPLEVHRRVIEVNLLGYINGAHAVLPFFREQNSGVLINLSSQVGVFGIPLVSSYVATKFGIRGFSESIREELQGTKIRVCTVLPASIDTPIFQHAANYTGRATQPLPPVLAANKVARAIVRLACSPRREVYVGAGGLVAAFTHALAPEFFEKAVARKIPRDHLQDEPAPSTPGNLFQPMDFRSIGGGWRDQLNVASTGAVIGSAAAAAIVLGAIGAFAFMRRARR